MLELIEVNKSYGGQTVLAPLTLRFESARTNALLGPSGCGKSTVLRLLVGLIEPDQGEVRFRGERLTPANLQGIRHRLGYMIQDGGLFPHLTIRENVTLMARRLRWDAARIEQRLKELLQLVHLTDDLLERRPGRLSGGQRQRVALMRALFLDPDVLLLDEPMGALDPLIRSELQQELRGIFQQLGKTVVLVTHDIGEAGYLADELTMLKDGRVVQRGTLEDLARRPADDFVRRFINAQRSPLEGL